jgi:general stress protein YciG
MADEIKEVPKKKGAMSVSEAGRKGGQTVRDKYGHAFYEQIGKKGGETVKAERGTPFYEEIGKKGGHKVRSLIEEGKKAALEAKAAAEQGTPIATPEAATPAPVDGNET